MTSYKHQDTGDIVTLQDPGQLIAGDVVHVNTKGGGQAIIAREQFADEWDAVEPPLLPAVRPETIPLASETAPAPMRGRSDDFVAGATNAILTALAAQRENDNRNTAYVVAAIDRLLDKMLAAALDHVSQPATPPPDDAAS